MIRENILRVLYLRGLIAKAWRCIIAKWDAEYVSPEEIEKLSAAGLMAVILQRSMSPIGSASMAFELVYSGNGLYPITLSLQHPTSGDLVFLAEVPPNSAGSVIFSAIKESTLNTDTDLFILDEEVIDQSITIRGGDRWEGYKLVIEDLSGVTENIGADVFVSSQREGDILTDCISEKKWYDILEYATDLAERCCCSEPDGFVVASIATKEPYDWAFPLAPETYSQSDGPIQAIGFSPANNAIASDGLTEISVEFNRSGQMGYGNTDLFEDGAYLASRSSAQSSHSGVVMTIEFGPIFTGGTYVVTIPPGFVKDSEGNSWQGASWTFSVPQAVTNYHDQYHDQYHS